MRFAKFAASIIGAAAGIIMLAALAGVLMGAFGGDVDPCPAWLDCAARENMRALIAVAAVSGLLSLLLLAGARAGAAGGAGVVLLGLVAGAAVLPEFILADDDARQSRELQSAIESAEIIRISGDFEEYAENVMLTEAGVSARRLIIAGDEAVRIRIDVSGEAAGDPLIELYREEQNGARQRIASDDDGGENLNARMERKLEPGTYLLIIRDISDVELSIGGVAFQLKISSVDLDKVIAQGNNAELTFMAGGAVCALEGERNCQLWPRQAVSKLGEQSDEDFYRLKLDTRGENACLVIDVHPTNDGDTILTVYDLDRRELGQNDDDDVNDFGSRLVIPIQKAELRFHDLLLHVGAYDDLSPMVRYSLYVELRPREPGGNCIASWDFRRGDEI